MKTRTIALRAVVVFALVFVVLLGVYTLRDHFGRAVLAESFLWASISSSVYFLSALYLRLQGHTCRRCERSDDTAG